MKRLMLCVLLVTLLTTPCLAKGPDYDGLPRNVWTDVFGWLDYWQERIFWWPFVEWYENLSPLVNFGIEGGP